jgi:hypothetical protein
VVPAPPGAADSAAEWPALCARRRRWSELLRMVFQVDVERCGRCGGPARIGGFVTEPRAVRKILDHLERRGVDARAGPWPLGCDARTGLDSRRRA